MMTQKHPMNSALTFWVKGFVNCFRSSCNIFLCLGFVALNKDCFSITAAFHMLKEDIHLETCCITGNLDVCLALTDQTLPCLDVRISLTMLQN